MTNLRKWTRRLTAIARSLPGYLAAATSVVMIGTPFLLEIIQDAADGLEVDLGWLTSAVTSWSARILVVVTLAANVYSRVTRVGEELQGLDEIETVTTALFREGPAGP